MQYPNFQGGFILSLTKETKQIIISVHSSVCTKKLVIIKVHEKKFNFGFKAEIYTWKAPNNPYEPCTFISLGRLGRFAPREIISTQYVRVLSFDHQIGIGSIVGRNSSWCNTIAATNFMSYIY